MNDFLRSIIGLAITFLGLLASVLLRIRILAFGANQKRLKRKYGIVRDTPVMPYGPRLEHAIETLASCARGPTLQCADIADQPSQTEDSKVLVAARCDQLLAQMNGEYRSKRASGRLGPIALMETRTRDFAERFAEYGSWETQFKFLPLYRFTC